MFVRFHDQEQHNLRLLLGEPVHHYMFDLLSKRLRNSSLHPNGKRRRFCLQCNNPRLHSLLFPPSSSPVQTALVEFYSGLGRVLQSRQVFDEMPNRDGFARTTMVTARARVRDLSSARGLLDDMPERNTASWNSIIVRYARLGDVESAKFLFSEMPQRI
ncbi:hypothetical protein RJ639_035016 [Escallonia herrerae]|uniref:Pentatricopeptide repeat-containing protein n=1 Tax=Escallonia herrerae TaxID=1293975 RepID=A0AA89B9B6_9ASTE|nr:hypothetical protein RJ639_035016 [Escallonia herrerae]